MEIGKREYIGDGVYVHFDGYQIVLETDRDGKRNWIALEEEVMHKLTMFNIRLMGWKMEERKRIANEDTNT